MSQKTDWALESQRALAALGLYTKSLDGQWGEGSHKALQAALAKLPKTETSNPTKDGYLIEVTRFKQSSKSTISRFKCNWTNISGYILEPAGPATAEANKNRRIPTGLYNLTPHTGAKYKRVVCLSNDQVPASRAILIHQGNTPANTVGCLIVGSSYDTDYVGTSVAKLNELMDAVYKLGAVNVKVRITEEFT